MYFHICLIHMLHLLEKLQFIISESDASVKVKIDSVTIENKDGFVYSIIGMPLVFIYISAGYINVSSDIIITKQHNPGDKYRIYAISVNLPRISSGTIKFEIAYI